MKVKQEMEVIIRNVTHIRSIINSLSKPTKKEDMINRREIEIKSKNLAKASVAIPSEILLLCNFKRYI